MIPVRDVSPLFYKTCPFVSKTCLFVRKTCPHKFTSHYTARAVFNFQQHTTTKAVPNNISLYHYQYQSIHRSRAEPTASQYQTDKTQKQNGSRSNIISCSEDNILTYISDPSASQLISNHPSGDSHVCRLENTRPFNS